MWAKVIKKYKETDKILVVDEADLWNWSWSTYTWEAERTVWWIIEWASFNNATMTEMWDTLIKQEKFPTLTNPSSTFTSSITWFREVWESINITFNASFNRWSINPQYSAESPFRAWLPNEYQYTWTWLTNQNKTTLTDSQIVNNYIVLINWQSWQGRVAYDWWVQPKSSYWNDFNSPLPAWNTNYITRTITWVYPYFWTTLNITTMTKQALANHWSVITINLVAESWSDKQSIEVPQVWGNLTGLEQWNPLSNSWDTISIASFTETSTTNTIQWNIIDYKKFTHNGWLIWARQLRFTF